MAKNTYLYLLGKQENINEQNYVKIMTNGIKDSDKQFEAELEYIPGKSKPSDKILDKINVNFRFQQILRFSDSFVK